VKLLNPIRNIWNAVHRKFVIFHIYLNLGKLLFKDFTSSNNQYKQYATVVLEKWILYYMSIYDLFIL